MKVIEYLKQHETLEAGIAALTAETGIVARDYSDYFVLNYSQFDSQKTHPIVIEARSLILYKDLTVASRSFDRFFNYGEALEINDKFDWNNSVVYEKVDGSLIKIWYDKYLDMWQIATRSSAQAEVPHPMGGTFRDWVLKAFRTTEEEFQKAMVGFDIKNTFIMEYIGPENRIVTRYEESQMVLLAIRKIDGLYYNLQALEEAVKILTSHKLNVRLVKMYPAATLADIAKMANELPALDEGYVAWDYVKDLRIKLKNPSYVAIHHLRENGQLSLKRICELVLSDGHGEYLYYFPEDSDFILPYVDKLQGILVEMNAAYEANKDIESQKDFALQVKDYPYSSVLFSARKTGKTVNEMFEESRMEWKVELLIGDVK